MNQLLEVSIYALLSGMSVFVGGLLSKYYGHLLSNSANKFLVAFGGGVIISALAFVLIPKGVEVLDLFPLIGIFLFGSLFFFLLDRTIEKKGGDLSQLLAMVLDFLPEAIALGATFATDKKTGILLALFIALQNLPESFNSFKDLKKSGFSDKKSLTILFFLSFVGVIGAVLGDLLLSQSPQITAGLMIFSSSGILYLIFQDIAPSTKMKNSWMPALGVNIGFLVGMIGERLVS